MIAHVIAVITLTTIGLLCFGLAWLGRNELRLWAAVVLTAVGVASIAGATILAVT